MQSVLITDRVEDELRDSFKRIESRISIGSRLKWQTLGGISGDFVLNDLGE